MLIVVAILVIMIIICHCHCQSERSYFTPDQARALGASQLSAMTNVQIAALSPEYIPVFTTEQLAGLTSTQTAVLGKLQIEAFTTAQFTAIKADAFTVTQIGFITAQLAPFISLRSFANFSIEQLQALGPHIIGSLTPQQIQSIPDNKLPGFQYHWDRISQDVFNAILPSQIKALDYSGFERLFFRFKNNDGSITGWYRDIIRNGWSVEQYRAANISNFSNFVARYPPNKEQLDSTVLDDRLQYLYYSNFDDLTFGLMTPEMYAKSSYISVFSLLDVLKINPTLISVGNFAKFPAAIFDVRTHPPDQAWEPVSLINNKNIGIISPAQFAALAPSTIKMMTPEVFASATPAQISAMTAEQIQALSVEQIAMAPVPIVQ